MKVLCIGHAAYDITTPFEGFPVENTKNRVPMRVECGGGPASNAAYLLGKWGIETYFAGIIGNDEFGKRIIDEFKEVNVDTKYLQVSNEFKTTSSMIIANTLKGTRTVLTYRPSDMKMDDVELDFNPDIILIDGQEYEFSKKVLEQYPDAISIIDAGRPTEKIIELSKMVDYVVCSKEFAENVTEVTIDYENNDTITNLFNKMKEIFKNNIIVTLESKGCLYEHDGMIKRMPSIKVKAIDSTGAGDIFHGAFTYGISKKWELEKILKVSNVAGALSVIKIGSRYSVPSKEEMKEVINEFE